MVLRILSLTKDWNKSLKVYVSLFFSDIFLSCGLTSKTIITMVFIIYSVDEAQLVVCGDDIGGLNCKLYRH